MKIITLIVSCTDFVASSLRDTLKAVADNYPEVDEAQIKVDDNPTSTPGELTQLH